MKKALLVIDYQNDFVDGSLGFESAKNIDTDIANLIDTYHQEGNDVIFTFDTHEKDYLQTKEGINLPTIHCLKDTFGHELYGNVKKSFKNSDFVFFKPTFGSLELANHLKEKAYDEVLIVGLVTNICVLANAILAITALPNANVIVNSRLVDSFDKKRHEETLDVLKGVGVNVI